MPPAAGTVLPVLRASGRNVVVNGARLTPPQLAELDRLNCGQQVPDGAYLLNAQTRLWAYPGHAGWMPLPDCGRQRAWSRAQLALSVVGSLLRAATDAEDSHEEGTGTTYVPPSTPAAEPSSDIHCESTGWGASLSVSCLPSSR